MSCGNPEIAEAMESWWHSHAGRHDDPAWRAFVADYLDLLTLKTDELLSEHDNAGRFGMSKAGGCTRASSLKMLQTIGEPLTGSTRATFFIGHILEAMALATLRALGHHIRTHYDGQQIAVTIDPFMRSTMDGVIDYAGRSMALSIKSMSYKMSGSRWTGGKQVWTRYGWTALAVAGVRAEQPGYWAQAQAEMYGSGLRETLFVAIAKDMVKKMERDPILIANNSLTFYAEIIPYDEDWCSQHLIPTWSEQWDSREASGKALPARIISRLPGNAYVEIRPGDPAGNRSRVFPTLDGKPTGYDPCDYCDMRKACEADYSK